MPRRLIKYPTPCKRPGENWWEFIIRDARGDGEDISWIVDCESQEECVIKPLTNTDCGTIDKFDYDKLRDMICEVLEDRGQERQPIRPQVPVGPPTGPPTGPPMGPPPVREEGKIAREVRKHPRFIEIGRRERVRDMRRNG